ncbi:hypothetical protein V5799_012204 [Amblyomma americanum]|uniref:Uncharacterized protein n=1 Tax=Amblyomma americanum TaxID=6943 RepID=A0AAQ4EF43_AMBAM
MGVAQHLKAPTKGELLLCLACSAYVVYYVLVVVRKPRVVCRTGHVRRFLCVQMEGFVKGYFRTPVWCIGANLQRLVGCLYHVVKKVRQRYPHECLLGVGVSLGGLLVSLYLCQRGRQAQLDAALAVSPPFQPAMAARALANPWGFNRLLNACITRGLVGRLRDNEDVVRASYFQFFSTFLFFMRVIITHNMVSAQRVIRADDVFRCWTLASFDRHYAAPAFGFQSVQDFYENCSLKGKLCMVQRPLVFLVSEDDSLNPETALPEDEVLKSPWLGAVVTPRGGHMGFVDGWLLPRQPFYAERFVVAFAVGLRKVCKARGVRVLHTLGN